jgi:hypothetical protein
VHGARHILRQLPAGLYAKRLYGANDLIAVYDPQKNPLDLIKFYISFFLVLLYYDYILFLSIVTRKLYQRFTLIV